MNVIHKFLIWSKYLSAKHRKNSGCHHDCSDGRNVTGAARRGVRPDLWATQCELLTRKIHKFSKKYVCSRPFRTQFTF